jgi:23S rRNA (guanosine2251-2'-O)-methyltransferase
LAHDKVIGRIPALECIQAGRRKAHRLFVLRDARGLEALRDAAAGIPVEECDRRRLDDLAGGQVHQGVVLAADPLPVHNADNWVREGFSDDALVIVLDGVEDPHNFGAIVRSAVACGVTGIIFGKDRSAPLSPAAMKSAAGAMEHAELVQATNLARCLKHLKDAGFWIAGLAEEGAQDIWDADLKGRTAIVVGGEGKGMRRLIREHCDFVVRIPLPGPITTLNASVSAAVALAECLRQRRQQERS